MKIWKTIGSIVVAASLIATIAAFGGDAKKAIENLSDVPELKQSVAKIADVLDELQGANRDLFRHLRGEGMPRDRALSISRIPIGQQVDTTGAPINFENFLDPDSLYVRGLLVMRRDDGSIDTLKTLYRFKTRKE